LTELIRILRALRDAIYSSLCRHPELVSGS
jgi:hypothetical protein